MNSHGFDLGLTNCHKDCQGYDTSSCTLCTDSDRDGVSDCDDLCYLDPNKQDPGLCGCHIEEDSEDSDRYARSSLHE